MVGFGYDIGSLKDEKNPIAEAYLTMFDNSPETLFATLMMALYPILENIPFSWIKRTENAKEVLINNASQMINTKTERGLHASHQRDILACMLAENERLQNAGEAGLSNDEMISQILTFLAAG
jgi:cytochrome P450